MINITISSTVSVNLRSEWTEPEYIMQLHSIALTYSGQENPHQQPSYIKSLLIFVCLATKYAIWCLILK